jgi:S-adenosylmethionine:tRNA ribosyltransferase-isomerase
MNKPNNGGSTLSDFDYTLPAELIAQHPPAERGQSRLLRVGSFERHQNSRQDESAPSLQDLRFDALPDLLDPRDLLVVNDTRVIRARLAARKSTGGKVEILIERLMDAEQALAQLRSSHAPAPGSTLAIEGSAAKATVLERSERFYLLRFDRPVHAVLEEAGSVPLPPYIDRGAQAEDGERYQTIYASRPGAVAAPTAGLHFTQAILDAIAAHGVAMATLTLHVGAGTFLPVQHEDLSMHRMHAERFEIGQPVVDAIGATRARGGSVVAVGTTTLRALEAAADGAGNVRAGRGETDIFITPGYRFQVVDRLITNFHLPRSTLLMLVSAFAGHAQMRAAYAHAIAQRYRFFSYGDAMLLDRATGARPATTHKATPC